MLVLFSLIIFIETMIFLCRKSWENIHFETWKDFIRALKNGLNRVFNVRSSIKWLSKQVLLSDKYLCTVTYNIGSNNIISCLYCKSSFYYKWLSCHESFKVEKEVLLFLSLLASCRLIEICFGVGKVTWVPRYHIFKYLPRQFLQ